MADPTAAAPPAVPPNVANDSSAKEQTTTQPTASVERLPDEIIEQVLRITDPAGFASLILVNRQWRRVSQQPHLYAHQLLRCPSYATSHISLPSARDEDLPRLRRLFALEVKRNLLLPFMRPSETTIKLISNSISSSSCPGGEGMQFSASAKGHHLLAYNSSRMHVLDVRGAELEVKREFKLRRRPVSAIITDDASTLVVLSTEMQLNLYDLTEKPPRRKHAIILDKNPRTMAISSCGSVLAAAYDSGIEVSSLHPGALSTDKREVKCDAVDALAFSFDGTQILGTTLTSSHPTTVVLTAPYYDPPGTSLEKDHLSSMWTTSILFPNTSHDCSHAILIQNGTQEEAAWAFTYDQSFETFRAIRIDDLRNGTTYFTGPAPKAASQSKLLPCTLPAATYHGQLVAAGFHRNEVWVYGVPEDLDAVPGNSLSSHDAPAGLGRNDSSRSNLSRHGSGRGTEATGERLPQWKLLCDKLRNNFVAGRKVTELNGLSSVKWVEGFGGSSSKERLVVTCRGVSANRLVTDEEDIDFIDGGRVSLLDFDHGLTDGTKREITIEVGTDDAEELKEEMRNLEQEVAIVRRRTVAQNRGGRNALLRAATTAGQNLPPLPISPAASNEDDDPLVPRRVGRNPATIDEADGEAGASVDDLDALESPYAHASPRSGTTLRRAATAAAINRRLNPRTADGRRIEYRRADGRGELPHESDADNWVPPPPPYQPDDPGAIPPFLQRPAVAPLPSPARPITSHVLHSNAPWQTNSPLWPGTFTPHPVEGSRRQSRQRTASDSTTYSRQRPEDIPRPQSTPSLIPDTEDLYDVSPPASPRPPQQEASTSHSQPVADSVSQTSTTETMARISVEAAHVQAEAAAASSAPEQLSAMAAREAPTLNVHIPTAQLSIAPDRGQTHVRRLSNAQTWPRAPQTHTPAAAEEEPTHVRRLSNAQTWPLAPHPEPDADRRIIPNDAQARRPIMMASTGHNDRSALPPPPSEAQMERLNKRISRGHPRRLSGGITTHWAVADSRQSDIVPANLQRKPVASGPPAFESSMVNPDEEQPLIISTPKGVSGAFDGPGSRMSEQRSETPILAPIPRRPRPNIAFNPRSPPEQQLATIFSPSTSQGFNSAPPQQKPRGLPTWLMSPPSTSSRSSLGINRRPSRAERSAAKNMQDARKRGWKPKGRKGKDQARYQERGWTDVAVTSPQKDGKKCIVM